jgi:hypothetical protein
MEEHRLRVLENRMLKEGGTRGWRKFYNEDGPEDSNLLGYYIVSTDK